MLRIICQHRTRNIVIISHSTCCEWHQAEKLDTATKIRKMSKAFNNFLWAAMTFIIDNQTRLGWVKLKKPKQWDMISTYGILRHVSTGGWFIESVTLVTVSSDILWHLEHETLLRRIPHVHFLPTEEKHTNCALFDEIPWEKEEICATRKNF